MITFLSRIFDLLSPRFCAICGNRLSISEQSICSVCDLHLPRTHYADCAEDNEMARLLWHLMNIQRAAALFFYQPGSPPSLMIEKLKYGKRPDIAFDLGQLTAREIKSKGFFEGIDFIIPLPLSKKRLRERGYNQSEEIAKGIAEETGLTVRTDIVLRRSFQQSQTKLGKWERNENVKGVFRLIKKEDIVGKHILIVDDIMTTGASILSCANELEKAGNLRISVLTLGFTKS